MAAALQTIWAGSRLKGGRDFHNEGEPGAARTAHYSRQRRGTKGGREEVSLMSTEKMLNGGIRKLLTRFSAHRLSPAGRGRRLT